MITIPPTIRPRVSQFVRLLASDADAEALCAARALRRALEAERLSLHDLADILLDSPADDTPTIARPIDRPPRWDDLERSLRVAWLDALLATALLTRWERSFATDMRAQTWFRPDKWRTPHQARSLNKLLVKAWAEGVRP